MEGYDNSQLPQDQTIYDGLANNIPDDFQPGIIHGDCNWANTMFSNDSGELAALIDWEMATIGDPLLDLGWIMASSDDGDGMASIGTEVSDGFLSISEMVSHCGKHSSRKLSCIQWYGVLACYKLAAILAGTYARVCAGKADKAVADQLHAAAVSLRAIRWLEHGLP